MDFPESSSAPERHEPVTFRAKKDYDARVGAIRQRSEAAWAKHLEEEEERAWRKAQEAEARAPKANFCLTWHVPRASDLEAKTAKSQGNMRQRYNPVTLYNSREEEPEKNITSDTFTTTFHLPNNQSLRLEAFKTADNMFAGPTIKNVGREPFDAKKWGKEEFIATVPSTSNKWANQELRIALAAKQSSLRGVYNPPALHCTRVTSQPFAVRWRSYDNRKSFTDGNRFLPLTEVEHLAYLAERKAEMNRKPPLEEENFQFLPSLATVEREARCKKSNTLQKPSAKPPKKKKANGIKHFRQRRKKEATKSLARSTMRRKIAQAVSTREMFSRHLDGGPSSRVASPAPMYMNLSIRDDGSKLFEKEKS